MMSTDITEFLTDLDAGNFEKKLSAALSNVAIGVTDNERKGKVVCEFEVTKVGASNVKIAAKLKFTTPTLRGDRSETDLTQTTMWVGKGGKMSFFPENQTQMFTKQGHVAEEKK